ncbi:EAL domain-containing protein [Shewanella indica]|jgi:EAL domain-containing protein (putative c-di-GMP-specific phosphodiesterase class I)|uniref:EAL domain-containing protein n=1 Tax=Shewanella indica TaxID=768528 RepID=UPI00399A3F7F
MLMQQRSSNIHVSNDGFFKEESLFQADFKPLTQAHLQEIVAREVNGCIKSVAYEVLFRPGMQHKNVEFFYQNLKCKELLNLSLEQLHQLAVIDYRNLDVLALTGRKIKRLFINVEARVIMALEAELVWLNDTLKQQDIELVIEITERLNSDCAHPAFISVAKLHDRGLKIALDDFEPEGDLRQGWIGTGCVDYIKLILPNGFECSEKIRADFIEHVYQLKDKALLKVIVEKVESLDQFLAMEFVPYDGLQGYFFSVPTELLPIRLKTHALLR